MIFGNCLLLLRSNSRSIVKPSAAGKQSTTSAGSHLLSLSDQRVEVTASKTVKQVDNSTLTEYVIGSDSEAKIVLLESYWPKDKVSRTTQCMDHRGNKRAK